MKDLHKRLPAPFICTSSAPTPHPATLNDVLNDILTLGMAGISVPGMLVIYPTEAYRLHPKGCQCGNAGKCEFCKVYINGPEFAEVEIA